MRGELLALPLYCPGTNRSRREDSCLFLLDAAICVPSPGRQVSDFRSQIVRIDSGNLQGRRGGPIFLTLLPVNLVKIEYVGQRGETRFLQKC